MAKAPTPATSVRAPGPPPLPIPPHHEAIYAKATIEENEFGKYICIPLVNTDPFGFEKKRKGIYRCKYCRSEQVSLSAWDALGI